VDVRRLGARIRQLRLEKTMTLQEAAAHAGVSVSMLSSVERGDKAPTVVVLDKIATGLGIRLADLLTGQADGRVIVRRADEQDVVHEPGGWSRTILTPVVPGVNFEMIRTTLPAGCDAGEFPAYAAGSHEYVIVESGTLRLVVADSTVDLHAGDSVYFAADAAHRYSNPATVPCSYYVAALIMRPRRPGASAVRRR
jgi:XRE family transcriptional regulator, regulator of sulfur utilization